MLDRIDLERGGGRGHPVHRLAAKVQPPSRLVKEASWRRNPAAAHGVADHRVRRAISHSWQAHSSDGEDAARLLAA